MAANAAATEDGEETSQPTAIARAPISAAAASTFAAVRPSSTTFSPSEAKRRAKARPSPTPAPVMTMVFDMKLALPGIHGEIARVGDPAAPERCTADLAEVVHRARERPGRGARRHGNAARAHAAGARAEILDGEAKVIGLLRAHDQLIARTVAPRLDLNGGELAALHRNMAGNFRHFDAVHLVVPRHVFRVAARHIVRENDADAGERLGFAPVGAALPAGIEPVGVQALGVVVLDQPGIPRLGNLGPQRRDVDGGCRQIEIVDAHEAPWLRDVGHDLLGRHLVSVGGEKTAERAERGAMGAVEPGGVRLLASSRDVVQVKGGMKRHDPAAAYGFFGLPPMPWMYFSMPARYSGFSMRPEFAMRSTFRPCASPKSRAISIASLAAPICSPCCSAR